MFFGCSRFTYYFVVDWTQACNKLGIGVAAGFCFTNSVATDSDNKWDTNNLG